MESASQSWASNTVASLVTLQVMDLVELEPTRNSLVGVAGQTGLSVEQRKRLTIAVELVANPSIVFMDVSPPSLPPSLCLPPLVKDLASASCGSIVGSWCF